jgi:hypothetical protein
MEESMSALSINKRMDFHPVSCSDQMFRERFSSNMPTESKFASEAGDAPNTATQQHRTQQPTHNVHDIFIPLAAQPKLSGCE